MFRPIAAFTAKPLGIVVGAIKDTFTRLPPLSALGQMDARTQADVWGLWYVFLLTWPLLHQILIDRQAPQYCVCLLLQYLLQSCSWYLMLSTCHVPVCLR